MTNDEARPRVAVRVVILDERSRVLLMAVRDPDDGRVVWVAPGGGAEPGETLEQTALRELAEEVQASAAFDLHGPIWSRHHLHTFDGRTIDLREWFFLSRVDAAAILDVRETGGGSRYFEEWRWWTLDELRAFEGIVAPMRLAELLEPVVRGLVPTEPIETGI